MMTKKTMIQKRKTVMSTVMKKMAREEKDTEDGNG